MIVFTKNLFFFFGLFKINGVCCFMRKNVVFLEYGRLILQNPNSQTPTNNNYVTNPILTYGGYSEQMNDGMCSGAPMAVPMQSTNGGVYIQMPMTSGPPPPYGLFTPHPAGGHQAAGLGMHPNYMNGPPPQLTPHGLPPPSIHGGAANSTTSSENAENICNTEMLANNGLLGMGSGGMHLQCPSFPPAMPFYYSTSGVPTSGGSGVVPTSSNGVHIVAPLPHHQVVSQASSNQTAFSGTHPAVGSQVKICVVSVSLF